MVSPGRRGGGSGEEEAGAGRLWAGSRCGEWSGLALDLRTDGTWHQDDAEREGAALDSEDDGCPESLPGLSTVPKLGPKSFR